MKATFRKPSKRYWYFILLVLSIVMTAGYVVWQTWLIRDDIGQLYTKVYEEPEYFDESYSAKGPESKVAYRIARQYVENLDVADPDSYSVLGDTEYVSTAVRVVELEVTNNEDWVYSAYNSIGTVDENGRLYRTISGIRSSQDKNYNPNGYGLELIPGGKGTMYLYFNDDGSDINRLYNIDASQEINLN